MDTTIESDSSSPPTARRRPSTRFNTYARRVQVVMCTPAVLGFVLWIAMSFADASEPTRNLWAARLLLVVFVFELLLIQGLINQGKRLARAYDSVHDGAVNRFAARSEQSTP